MKFSIEGAIQSLVVNAMMFLERRQSGISFNPLSDEVIQDPYPTFAKLREISPIHHSRLMNVLLFSRYADANTILRDHNNFSNEPNEYARHPTKNKMVRSASLPLPDEKTIFFMDPPDHTRMRSLVNKAFTRAAINGMEPVIRGLITELLDEIDDPSNFDYVQSLSTPLPVLVIAELLGIPKVGRPQFMVWAQKMSLYFEPTPTRRKHKLAMAAVRSLEKEVDAYLLPIIQDRRREPRDDFLTRLVQAEEQGDKLSEEEMMALLKGLLVAGGVTTINLLGNGMLAMLRHPEQTRLLREDPERIPTAVEEMLRYDPPAQMSVRRVSKECDINGLHLYRDQKVLLLIGAANRDPDAFENPEQLDFTRTGQEHLAFSRGIHYCIGATLARLEARLLFEMMMERFSSFRMLDENPKFRANPAIRSLNSLPMSATPASSST